MISGTMLVHNGGGVYLFALWWCVAACQVRPLRRLRQLLRSMALRKSRRSCRQAANRARRVVQAGAPVFNAASNAAAGIGRAYR
jgi:hypothetical protein